MKRLFISLFVLAMGLQAGASELNRPFFSAKSMEQMTAGRVQALGIDWKVGDTADYNVDMGFLQGTMKMFVKQDTGTGIWVQQDIDMMIQKQTVEMLIEKSTGKVLEVRVNGEKQNLPESDPEIVETKPEHITVPAGSFDTVYFRIKDKKTGDESQAWLNLAQVPMMGMVKSTQPSQFGEVTIELTAFHKQ